MPKRQPRLTPICLSLICFLLLISCGQQTTGPSMGGTPAASPSSPSPSASAQPSPSPTSGSQAQKNIKLVVWDTATSGVQKEIIETLAREFEKDNPGVQIEHEGYPFDELQKTLQRAITSGKGPDIAQINNGESSMGPLVRAKLLIPLTKYDKQYGWSKKFAPALLARNMYTEDGKTFGKGVLWGVSQTGELVGFYYNKKIFQQNGIQVPKTFDELEQVMQTLKDKGVTPLIFGNLDKWQAIHLYGEILGTMTNREYLDGLIYRQGNKSWDTPQIKQAAAKLQEWESKGYFIKNYAALHSDDAWKLFAAGKGAMLLQGSWLTGDIQKAMGSNAGFFAMPPRGNKTVLHVGGVGIPYGIIKTTKYPDVAAKFINFLVSDRAVQLLLENGQLPAIKVPQSYIKPNTVSGDLYKAWNKVNDENALGHYLDWATPTFYDTLTAHLQLLLAHKESPDQFAKALEADYSKFLQQEQK